MRIESTLDRKLQIVGILSAKQPLQATLLSKGFVVGNINVTRVREYDIQQKETTSSFEDQVVLPDGGYYMSRVKVNAMPMRRELNQAGGFTLIVGE